MGYMVNNQTGARYEFQDDMNGPRNRLSDLLTQYGASAANPIDYMGQKGYLTPGAMLWAWMPTEILGKPCFGMTRKQTKSEPCKPCHGKRLAQRLETWGLTT